MILDDPVNPVVRYKATKRPDGFQIYWLQILMCLNTLLNY